MKKIVIRKYGGYDQLHVEDSSEPIIKENEVLVKNKSIGINYADVCIRWGIYESAKKFIGLPITPGFEYAGIVEKIGSKVSHFKIGDRVFGISFFGAYSEKIAVDQNFLFPLPDSINLELAGAIPVAFLTAYHALFHHVIIPKNSRVLVHSAAGGVGQALVQLLKNHECQVTGVVGQTHKIEFLKKIKTDFIIDKSKENLWEKAREFAPNGYDFILDANGQSTLKNSYKHLAPMGKLISYGFHSMLPKKGGKINYLSLIYNYLKTPTFSPIKMTNENKSIIAFNLSFLFDHIHLYRDSMDEMIPLFEQNKLIIPEVTKFKFSDIAKAHEMLESGKSVGKLVLIT